MSSKKAKKTKKTNKINKTKKVKIKHLPEIILVVSALFLGMLIVILVWKGKTTQIIEPERVIQGSFPTPAELVEEDKLTYFAYMDVPDMIFKKMDGVTFNEDCPVAREDLCYMKVLYWGIDKEAHQGELIVNKAIAPDLVDIFYRLYKASYPIGKIELVENYGGNDEVSMSNNNIQVLLCQIYDYFRSLFYGCSLLFNIFSEGISSESNYYFLSSHMKSHLLL